MQAVGQLTGGIAHDFNNLLTVLSGYSEILLQRLANDPEAVSQVNRIIETIQRSAALTHRLLAFSGQQTLSPRPTSATALISGITDMLHRTLGETIVLEIVETPNLWNALVDPPQLENALVNLVINARDAMPDGGMINIKTANETLEKAFTDKHDELSPGDYVAISVRDQGTGMSAEVRQRIFEPYFTTKNLDKGTGLGLSMVYGFIKQSSGHISVDSKIGEGTVVTLYLPRTTKTVSPTPQESRAFDEARAESETVLVVEDDKDVRAIPVTILGSQGYKTLEASNGQEAVEILKQGARSICCLPIW